VIKAVIIDDELSAANVLRLMLQRHVPQVTQVVIETKPEKAVALLQQYKPDLVFLDVIMPVLTGFDLLNQYDEIPFEIVFTTAFDEFAIQAIRFSAVDYLLKPIDADELKNAVQRVIKKKQDRQSAKQILLNLSHNLHTMEESQYRLAVSTSQGVVFFKIDEIIRVEGEGNYSRIVLTGNRLHVCAKTLKDFEELLPRGIFLRIHKSFIINRNFIINFLKKGEVVLSDHSTLPVSRRKRTEITNILLNKQQ
jgi:two-component system LytT family response regulator